MKKILFLTLVLILLCALISCQGTVDTEYNVKFISDEVTFFECNVKSGETVAPPPNPTKEGYTFISWQYNGADWSFTTPVTSDITLEAKWEVSDTVKEEFSFKLSETGDYYIFSGIGNVTSAFITIPSEYNGLPVKEVSERALYGNKYITEINIPASIITIKDEAFAECTSLKCINVDVSNTSYSSLNSNLYTKGLDTLIQYAIGCEASSFELPEKTTAISARAFARAENLKEISLHNKIYKIGKYAFYRCTSLENANISLDAPIDRIEVSTFSGCTSLVNTTLPSYVKSIDGFAFFGCSSLETVDLGTDCLLNEIGDSAFMGCESLESFRFGGSKYKFDTLVSIGDANETLKSAEIFFYVGGYESQEGAWTPSLEYSNISYGVWLSEEDYLAGENPVKWYTTTELISANIGTIANDGLEYEDPEFIPGYVHFYKDVTCDTEQITIGHTQALIMNLGGHTFSSKKGMRIGGNDSLHPLASLLIKNGTFIANQGTQIQVRSEARFTLSRVSLIDNTSNYIIYGSRGKEVKFEECEYFITSSSQIYITAPFKSGGDPYRSIRFLRTEVHILDQTRTAPLFKISENKYGECNWEIIFDKNSAIYGKIPELVILTESLYETDDGNYMIDDFKIAQRCIFEKGFTFDRDSEPVMTYQIVTYDREQFTANDTVSIPANDGIFEIVINAIPGVDYDVIDDTINSNDDINT